MNLIDENELQRQIKRFWEVIKQRDSSEITRLDKRIDDLLTFISQSSSVIPSIPSKNKEETKQNKETSKNIPKDKITNEKALENTIKDNEKEKLELEKKELETKNKLETETKEKERLAKLEKEQREKQLEKEKQDKLKKDNEAKEAERLAKEKLDKENKEKQEKEQADKKRIDDLWNTFFTKHDITNDDNKKSWKDKFIEDTAKADKLYEDALTKNSKGQTRKNVLTEEQIKTIKSAKTPQELKEKRKQLKILELV